MRISCHKDTGRLCIPVDWNAFKAKNRPVLDVIMSETLLSSCLEEAAVVAIAANAR